MARGLRRLTYRAQLVQAWRDWEWLEEHAPKELTANPPAQHVQLRQLDNRIRKVIDEWGYQDMPFYELKKLNEETTP